MFNWLQHLADWLIYSVLKIDSTSKLGDALNFFVYDSIKIFILLMIVTLLMGTINSYFPIDKVR
ncbi:MAG TPA: permease, partial [Cyclobacteriaceae bacterium]|nr:permease [Cyclobacteriaceae bacterium]